MEHMMECAYTFQSGATMWECPECEYACIIHQGRIINLFPGADGVFHSIHKDVEEWKIPDIDIKQIGPNVWEVHYEVAEPDKVEPITFEEQMELAHTSFYDWIVEHMEELENL